MKKKEVINRKQFLSKLGLGTERLWLPIAWEVFQVAMMKTMIT